jgi:cytochrome P450
VETTDLPVFPFTTPSAHEPPQEYVRLRIEEPVSRVALAGGGTAWIVTRHQDVRTVLGDPRFSRAAAASKLQPGDGLVPTVITGIDPPEHTRLRQLVAPAFTGRHVELLRPRVEQIADELLSTMAAAGPPADLVAAYAAPLPVTVFYEQLGVPTADRAQFQQWADAVISQEPARPTRPACVSCMLIWPR